MHDSAQTDNCGALTVYNGGGISGKDYVPDLHWLGGWATYFPYRTLKLIGGYDDNFVGGYGVDIDHTYRIIKAGLFIRTINYWVDHTLANTREHDRNPNTEQMKKEAGLYFKKKWG